MIEYVVEFECKVDETVTVGTVTFKAKDENDADSVLDGILSTLTLRAYEVVGDNKIYYGKYYAQRSR